MIFFGIDLKLNPYPLPTNSKILNINKKYLHSPYETNQKLPIHSKNSLIKTI